MYGNSSGALSAVSSQRLVGTTETAVACRPIEVELNALGKAVDDLHERVNTLATRIQPVMGPELPCASGVEKGVPEQTCGPFAGEIRSIRRRVESIGMLTANVLSRLEV